MKWEDGTRITRVHTRYEIGDGDSLLETAPSRLSAFAVAVALSNRERRPMFVFDSMARVGCGLRWKIYPGAAQILALKPIEVRS